LLRTSVTTTTFVTGATATVHVAPATPALTSSAASDVWSAAVVVISFTFAAFAVEITAVTDVATRRRIAARRRDATLRVTLDASTEFAAAIAVFVFVSS